MGTMEREIFSIARNTLKDSRLQFSAEIKRREIGSARFADSNLWTEGREVSETLGAAMMEG